MDPYHIIVGEINNVVSSMKLNVRYTSPNPRNSAKQQLENGSPLLRAFKNLQENVLYSHRDITSLDTLVYLKPFLNVIRSEETTGPITGVALTSVNKFLNNFITENSPNISKAIENVAEAVTHCRFEATDPDSDEVVLMKILQVLLSCIKSPVVVFLTEELILEMVQTCFRISSQIRLSELLRRTAENTLTEMIQALFIKLRTNPSVFDKPLQSLSPSSSESSNSPRGAPSANNSSSSVTLEPQQSSSKEAVPHTVDIENLNTMNVTQESGTIKEFVNPQGVRFEKGDSGKPFGISCLIRLINFISGIIKLPSGESEEGMEYTVCLMGLNLSNTILEACGKSLQNFPPILKLIQETLSAKIAKCMISDDLQILSSTLRAFYNMFSYLGEHLKMQMELFFNSIIRIMEWKSVSYSQQEIILESVLNFCKEPDFMVNL